MGLQLRRGIDSDRTGITPAQGEPIYVTDTGKLYIGDGVTPGGVLVAGDVSDSAGVAIVINQVVDSAYVQARQTDFFRDSAFVTDIVDAAYIQARDRIRDSGFVEDIVDSAFVQARQITYDFLDSAEAINLIDSAYINARTDANIDSVALIAVVDSAYVQARQTPQDFAYSSLTGAPTNVSSFTNDANYLDSSTVVGVITAAYIQANQTTYNTADFTDSTYVANEIQTAINNLIDGAPGTLDTLNEIAAALNDDDSAYATLVGLINDQLDSAEVTALIDAAYVQARQITYNTSDFTDSAFVTGLPVSTFTNDANYLDSTTVQGVIDATYIQANQTTYSNVSEFNNDANYLDSTTATVLIDSAYINARTDANIDSVALIALVDSAYVQARQAPGTDSAAVTSLITTTVDSAYVNARVSTVDSGQVLNIVELDGYTKLDSTDVINLLPDGTYRGLRTFVFTADSGDTTFTGVDDFGNTLLYSPQNLVVYANGILLVDSADYTATNGTTISLVQAADSADVITVHNIVAGGLDSAAALELVIDGTYRGLRTYTFTADSGDTAFTGTDDFGNTLAYSRQSLVVYVNGILLTDSVDYTALDGSTITLTNPADSADVITFHNIVAGGQVDSALVNQLLLANVDSAYIQARQADIYRDSGFVTGIIDASYIQANQTTYDFLDSAETIALIDSAYVQARQITYNTSNFTDSAFVTGLPVSTFTNDAYYLDSTTVTGVIDAAYVQANQITYNTSDFADSAFVTAQINALIDGAPTTLDTLNEIAAALNDNDSAYNTLISLIGAKTDFDSADAIAIVDSAYVQARQTAQDFAYSSLTGAPNVLDSSDVVSLITANDQQRDSGFVTGIIDSDYIQSRQDFAYSSLTGAPNVLDSTDVTNHITGSDLDMGGNKVLFGNVYDSVGALPNASTYHGMFAHVHATGAGYFAHAGNWVQLANNSDISTYGDANVTSLVDSAYVQARQTAGTDSAATIALITSTVDSAYVALREANAGGGTDSATVISLAQSAIDSDYVLARIPDATLQGVNQFEFLADSGQTVFTGADRDGNSLTYNATDVLVFLNGTLMVPGNDFNTTNSNTITFTEGVDSGDFVNIFNFTAGRAVGGGVSEVNHFDFTADSGQTAFTGSDDNGSILSFIGNDNIQVFINGILLKQSDYTISNNNTVTLTDGADSADEVRIIAYDTYSQRVAIDTYNFTADSGQTVFTGLADDGNSLVFSPGNLQVHLNGIMLRSGNDFSTSGTGTVTLVSGADSGDTLTVTAISGDSAGYATIVPAIVDSAYINARVTIPDAGTDSADVVNIITAEGFTKYDSNDTIGLVDSAYISTRFPTGGSSNVIVPFAFAFVNTTSNGSGTGISWSNWNSGNASLDFTFDVAQPNANYAVVTESETFDDYFVGITNKTTTGFTAAFYDATQNRTPSSFSPFTFLIYGSNPQQRIAGLVGDYLDSSTANALIGSTVDSAYVQARQTAQDFAYSSLTGAPTAVSSFTNDANYLDSTTVTGVISTSYIQANQTTYSTANFADSAFVTAQINALIDGAPGTLNTLNEIAAALNDDDSAYTTLVNLINAKSDYDSADATAQITGIVDSAYVNARVSTVDSGQVLQIVELDGYTKIDSADVLALVPDGTYRGIRKYSFTADSGQSLFTGADDNSNTLTYSYQSIVVYVNGILLNDSVDYTATNGSSVSLITAADLGDVVTIHNIVAGGTDSALINNQILSYIDSAYVQARQVDLQRDSAFVTNIIDAAYIQANQTTYDFLDSAEAIALIATQGYLTDAIDSARITSMLAADSFSIGGTIIGDGKIEIKNTTGSTPSYVDLYCEVSNAHYTRIQSEAHANYSGNVTLTTPTTSGTLALTSDIVDSAAIITLIQANDQQRDSAFVTGIIDSAYIAARTSAGTDSASVIALITSTVDSAYVALREANAGGSGGSVDSAAIISLIQATVDSAYVTARDPGGTGGVTFKTFQYLADSGQIVFTGTDDLGNSLAFVPDQYQVYRNGILLIDSDDYNGTGGGTITLTDTSVTGDQITIATYTATVGSSISTYDYFADSGQTSFSGADIDGNTLSFTGSNVLVHVNGLLLTDSNDYTRVGGSTITFDNGLDSGDVVSIIAVTDAVSSGSGGTDSATVLSLVQGLVDSAYVQARQSFTTGLLVDTYSYTADSAQTIFSGADNASNTLKYTAGEIQVFRNGILLVDSDDYIASNGTSITLTSGANLGDNLSVTAFTSADQIVQLNTFEYTADSGATSFSGTDDFGNSLTYNVGNILVHLNGILLTDSADYTANNGTTIVLSTAADSADILHISAFGTATALNKWRETAVSYTTEAGTKLIVDTSSGAVTVTLPDSPVFGDEVKIIDGTGNAGTNNITINRNSNKILGADSDFTLDVNRAAVDLVYYNAAQGWIVSGNS